MTPFGLALNENEFQRICVTITNIIEHTSIKRHLDRNKGFFVLPFVQSLVVESQISPL